MVAATTDCRSSRNASDLIFSAAKRIELAELGSIVTVRHGFSRQKIIEPNDQLLLRMGSRIRSEIPPNG